MYTYASLDAHIPRHLSKIYLKASQEENPKHRSTREPYDTESSSKSLQSLLRSIVMTNPDALNMERRVICIKWSELGYPVVQRPEQVTVWNTPRLGEGEPIHICQDPCGDLLKNWK